jgi:hypothetical protein
LNLLQEFHDHDNEIRVQAVKAAALYGEGNDLNQASKIFGGGKKISQCRSNQNIWDRGQKKSVDHFITLIPPIKVLIKLSASEVAKKS